jgi:hypothetical protein
MFEMLVHGSSGKFSEMVEASWPSGSTHAVMPRISIRGSWLSSGTGSLEYGNSIWIQCAACWFLTLGDLTLKMIDILFPHTNKVSELSASEKDWRTYLITYFRNILIAFVTMIFGGLFFLFIPKDGLLLTVIIDFLSIAAIIICFMYIYASIRWKNMVWYNDEF